MTARFTQGWIPGSVSILSMEIMRKIAAACAILIYAATAAVGGTVCQFPCQSIVGLQADVPSGHAKALTEICKAVGEWLDQRPALMAQGPVQLDLVKITRTGMTLRLTQQRGRETVTGQPLSLTTFDSDRFLPAAVRQMADLLIRNGPFANPSD